MKKNKAIKGLFLSFALLFAVAMVSKSNVSANVGWWATKSLGGGEGAQWFAAGAVGYLGAEGGAWAGGELGAMIGTAAGPVGTVVGGALGAGVGAL